MLSCAANPGSSFNIIVIPRISDYFAVAGFAKPLLEIPYRISVPRITRGALESVTAPRAALPISAEETGWSAKAALCLVALLFNVQGRAQQAPPPNSQEALRTTDVSDQEKQQVAPPGLGLARWINPVTAPFIPVPVIGADPNSGTTLGILPTWVHTNEADEISRIIAPDLIHNPNFGWGLHGRIFDYPSQNEQWSIVAGISERTQRGVDAEYQTELSRKRLWSLNYSLIYDQNGTERFYGLGNGTRKDTETDYTKSQELFQFEAGLNLNHEWQILFTLRPQRYEVRPGVMNGVQSIETRFPTIDGLGATSVVLNRVSIVYDTRDSAVVPTQGMRWVEYGGLASRGGILNDSMYSEAGLDGRAFWPLDSRSVLAAHAALHYIPSAHDLPFWANSSLGGDRDFIGGDQMLRGFGAGRYFARNSLAGTIEYRRTVLGFNAAASHVDIEATPFLDVGNVFSGGNPAKSLHKVIGLGLRGVARPFIVGYVDFGYGSDGIATFTGINYPF
jgi:hypothetical protein